MLWDESNFGDVGAKNAAELAGANSATALASGIPGDYSGALGAYGFSGNPEDMALLGQNTISQSNAAKQDALKYLAGEKSADAQHLAATGQLTDAKTRGNTALTSAKDEQLKAEGSAYDAQRKSFEDQMASQKFSSADLANLTKDVVKGRTANVEKIVSQLNSDDRVEGMSWNQYDSLSAPEQKRYVQEIETGLANFQSRLSKLAEMRQKAVTAGVNPASIDAAYRQTEANLRALLSTSNIQGQQKSTNSNTGMSQSSPAGLRSQKLEQARQEWNKAHPEQPILSQQADYSNQSTYTGGLYQDPRYRVEMARQQAAKKNNQKYITQTKYAEKDAPDTGRDGADRNDSPMPEAAPETDTSLQDAFDRADAGYGPSGGTDYPSQESGGFSPDAGDFGAEASANFDAGEKEFTNKKSTSWAKLFGGN